MKLISIILLNVLLLSYLSSSNVNAQQSCTADYQCNSIPYGLCAGSADDCPATLPGVAVDEVNNLIYYVALCRPLASDATNYPLQNATIKRVNINGGTPITVFSTIFYPAQGNIGKVFTVANGALYYDRTVRSIGNPLISYNLQSRQDTFLFPTPGAFQSNLDIAGGYSFTCQLEYGTNSSYSIVRFNGAIAAQGGSTSPEGTRIYSLGNALPCGPVRLGVGTDLIFTGITSIFDGQNTIYTTTFYRGTVSGSASLPPVLFTVSEAVTDFDVASSGAIVYGTRFGLFSRVGTTTTVLNNERITGVTIIGQRVLYNNGVTIRSTNLNGQNTVSLIQPTTGVCTCRSGFSGSNCQTCNNGQIQFYEGIPRCVPVNSAGVPSACYYDYQCGNVPYTLCFGSCNCRANFTGDRCDQCASPRALTFRNGIPYCE